MIKELLLVGAGGFIGSIARYLISMGLMTSTSRAGFPVGTFIVNAIGALLIGILAVSLTKGAWQQLCIVGFCGGFTTFSAFSLESLKLLKDGSYGLSAAYILGSVAVCLLFVWLGSLIGGSLKAS